VKRSDDRILTTHAGSLPRPPDLERDGVRGSVAGVVREQAACGLDSVNDGEFSKSNFTFYAESRLEGIEVGQVPEEGEAASGISARDRQEFPGYFENRGFFGGLARRLPPRPVVRCVAPLTYAGQAEVQADIDNLRAALDGVAVEEAFLPAVAPGTVEHWLTNDHYPSQEAFVHGIADALGEEYRAIVDAGFLLQIDDPDLLDAWQMYPEMSVAEYRRYAKVRIDALNHALRGVSPDSVRLHVCWGSFHGPHKHDLPLSDIVDLVLEVEAGAYSIEASNPRHDHDWRVWRDVRLPEGKVLIPGVVGHASDFIEHPQLVADRLVRYAGLVGRENVLAGTDCGLGNRVGHPEITWAKLQALVEGAQLASAELWG
jgi:5-methyltetrahydropteroyltriglutamate--homocysteine methyltransferase